jgi:hypothetical protein
LHWQNGVKVQRFYLDALLKYELDRQGRVQSSRQQSDGLGLLLSHSLSSCARTCCSLDGKGQHLVHAATAKPFQVHGDIGIAQFLQT